MVRILPPSLSRNQSSVLVAGLQFLVACGDQLKFSSTFFFLNKSLRDFKFDILTCIFYFVELYLMFEVQILKHKVQFINAY